MQRCGAWSQTGNGVGLKTPVYRPGHACVHRSPTMASLCNTLVKECAPLRFTFLPDALPNPEMKQETDSKLSEP